MTTTIRQAIAKMAAGQGTDDKSSPLHQKPPSEIKGSKACSSVLLMVVTSKSMKNPLPVPQQAFGIWG